MNEWKTPIYCYVSPAGNNKIWDWYSGLSVQEKSDADEFLKTMRKTRDWKMPFYLPRLSGIPGIGELRWYSGSRQHRLLGFFFRGCWCALVGCTHKQRRYDPPDALETAKKYKGRVERGEVNIIEYNF